MWNISVQSANWAPDTRHLKPLVCNTVICCFWEIPQSKLEEPAGKATSSLVSPQHPLRITVAAQWLFPKWIAGWMIGRMGGWVDGWLAVDEWTDKWVGGWVHEWMGKCISEAFGQSDLSSTVSSLCRYVLAIDFPQKKWGVSVLKCVVFSLTQVNWASRSVTETASSVHPLVSKC